MLGPWANILPIPVDRLPGRGVRSTRQHRNEVTGLLKVTREHLAAIHLEHGNNEMLKGRQVEAMAEFRTALNLDPQNEFAQQRVNDALGSVPARSASQVQVVASADALTPKPEFGVTDPAAALKIIREDLGDCTRCKLATQGRKQIVFGVGNPRAELMFVGEGPGADEDMQGEPFVGRSGQLLNNMIRATMVAMLARSRSGHKVRAIPQMAWATIATATSRRPWSIPPPRVPPSSPAPSANRTSATADGNVKPIQAASAPR